MCLAASGHLDTAHNVYDADNSRHDTRNAHGAPGGSHVSGQITVAPGENLLFDDLETPRPLSSGPGSSIVPASV